jgi:hypothetical protein
MGSRREASHARIQLARIYRMRYQFEFDQLIKPSERGPKMSAWGLFLFTCLLFLLCHSRAFASPSLEIVPQLMFDGSTRLSVVFASQNNHQPESAFGHVFLVFHKDDSPEPDAVAVEFVGHVASFTDMVLSVSNEVSGRYKLAEFSQKKLEYDLEDRDLFVFELNVSAEELLLLKQDITYELTYSYPYSFTKRNCGFYLNQLLTKRKISAYDLSADFVVKPIHVLDAIESSRIKHVKFLPSSHRTSLYFSSKLTAEQMVTYERFLLGYDLPDGLLNEQLRNAVSSRIRYQLPRESNSWMRQHMAQQQKTVWHTDPLDVQKKYDDESKGHYTFATQSDGVSSFKYQSELRNFATQHPNNSTSSYLDVFATELTLKDQRLYLSEFSIIKSEAMQPTLMKARLLELSYRNWNKKTDADEKEVYASLGIGTSYEVSKVRVGIIPNLTVAYSDDGAGRANARLGYRAISEFRAESYAVRYSIDHWRNTPFNFSREMNLQLRVHLNSKMNLGFELNRIPEIHKTHQRLLLTYSL